jgi:hypothetical protein
VKIRPEASFVKLEEGRTDIQQALKPRIKEFSVLQNNLCLYLATGQADHDLVAVFNHVEIGNSLTRLAAKALLQFVLVDRESAHDAKSVRCDERPAFYAKTHCRRSTWRKPDTQRNYAPTQSL